MVDLALALAGLVALLVGADQLVEAARAVARRVGVSELVVGLTITSIGTSLPELATSTSAALQSAGEADEAAGLAIGNLVGSNLFLLAALLGGSAVVRAVPVDIDALRRDGTAVSLATAAVIAMCVDGTVGRVDAAMLLAGFVAYVGVLLRDERARRERPDAPVVMEGPAVTTGEALRIVLGLIAVLVGAHYAVERGVSLAIGWGVPGAVLGLWMGIGTSLPELVVTLQAARRGASELSLGNALGSAIANFTLCLGVAAAASPLGIAPATLWFDAPFLVAATAIALALMAENRELSRTNGAVLLVIFALYLFLRTTGVGVA